VPSDRLTRQELTWLLTQEARTAAAKLREGVAVLSTAKEPALASPPPPSIEPELDALDDAMKMLTSLHGGLPARGRRGRIDLSSLVWEVAPGARVSIEPGSGTEVFGDEIELRRMLQVLLGSTSPTTTAGDPGASEVSIRREGGEVSVTAVLGPDSSAHAGTERAWLSRMATRYGGRLVLDGGTESILLPADGADDQIEVESLKRELARAFSSYPPPGFTLNLLTTVASALASRLCPVFANLEREVAQGHDSEAIGAQIALGSEVAFDLARLGRCSVRDTVHTVDVGDVLRAVVGDLLPRAKRRGVALSLSADHSPEIEVGGEHLALLVRTLANDAILATPHGGCVKVTLRTVQEERTGAPYPVVSIDDGGPPIGKQAYQSIVAMQIDPSSVGRPSTIAQIVAHALAQHLGAIVSPGDSVHGRMDLSLAPYRPAG
jgi:two-component system OmpR family sensor kinase